MALLLASGVADAGSTVTIKGVRFGPQQRLTCEWFTNFENSRFERCSVAGKPVALPEDGASIHCSAGTCERLDAEARRVADWKEPEPVWGNFIVEFDGRIGLARHRQRYLGDGSGTVLVEKLVSVRKRS